jgi:hypothetical protein
VEHLQLNFCIKVEDTKGCKGGEHCQGKRTTIHKNTSGSTIIHKGASNGKSTLKDNGDGKA